MNYPQDKSVRRSEMNRRAFLGLTGAAGLGIAGCAETGTRYGTVPAGSGKFQQITGTSAVSITRGTDRRQATYDSLKPLANDVAGTIGSKQVVIKVNAGFPTEGHRIHSTYPDQVRGILDFLGEFYEGPIIIAEGVGSSTTGNMHDGYELYGITPLTREYENITLVDANRTTLARKYIHQFQERPEPIHIIQMYFDPNNYIISAARFKTHNAVVATFSLKNIVMGSPVGSFDGRPSEKFRMHGGRIGVEPDSEGQELSYNIFRLALEGVYPDLGVVDGITGIEGDGPWDGTEVDHGIAIASTDFVACDRVCTDIMKVDPFVMKYLEWCGEAGLGNWDRNSIRTIGANPEEISIQYEMNPNYERQVGWIERNFER